MVYFLVVLLLKLLFLSLIFKKSLPQNSLAHPEADLNHLSRKTTILKGI